MFWVGGRRRHAVTKTDTNTDTDTDRDKETDMDTAMEKQVLAC